MVSLSTTFFRKIKSRLIFVGNRASGCFFCISSSVTSLLGVLAPADRLPADCGLPAEGGRLLFPDAGLLLEREGGGSRFLTGGCAVVKLDPSPFGMGKIRRPADGRGVGRRLVAEDEGDELRGTVEVGVAPPVRGNASVTLG